MKKIISSHSIVSASLIKKKKNVILTGANGMLGSSIQRLALKKKEFNFIFTDLKNLDITNKNQISEFFKSTAPDIVINCAAYTNVDSCEKNYKSAEAINAAAPGYLAEFSKKYGASICHISTDYVYKSTALTTPLTENSPLGSDSVYGRTKLAGEFNVQNYTDRYFILRTSWMFGYYGENFFKCVITQARNNKRLNLINDAYGNPTYSDTLAAAILTIVQSDKFGIYNISNAGSANWFEFGSYILKTASFDKADITPVSAAILERPAPRPKYSVMNISKALKTFNIKLPEWRAAVKKCWSEYKQQCLAD